LRTTDERNPGEYFKMFCPPIGENYLDTLGQALLAIVTLGLYAPWAIIKVYNYYLENIAIEKPAANLAVE
jgi:uncharacterized membrane protein YjgN (DUF898 family)